MTPARRAQLLTLAGAVALILCHGARLLIWYPAGSALATAAIVLFLTAPVAVCLPGVLRGRNQEFICLSMLSLPLFMHAGLLAFSPDQRIGAIIAIGAIWVMFAGTVLWLRAVPAEHNRRRAEES